MFSGEASALLHIQTSEHHVDAHCVLEVKARTTQDLGLAMYPWVQCTQWPTQHTLFHQMSCTNYCYLKAMFSFLFSQIYCIIILMEFGPQSYNTNQQPKNLFMQTFSVKTGQLEESFLGYALYIVRYFKCFKYKIIPNIQMFASSSQPLPCIILRRK